MSEQNYKGEYKVGLSDDGRVSFDLNWKWLVSILVTVIGCVGYLIIDKYHIQPINDLKVKIEEHEKFDGMIQQLIQNQKILLDRSDRMEKWMEREIINNNNINEIPLLPSNINTEN